MADIKPYVDAISKAVYGEEVRGAIINALIKVNDDNNSYQDLKKEVVEAKDKVEEEVASFDEKMQTATEIERKLSGTTSAAEQTNDDLVASILSGSRLKNGLDSDIEEAEHLKSEMPGVIQAAGEAKSALEGSVESAGTAKRELDTSRESASGMNDTLKQTIQNAGNKDTQLSSTIDTAVMKNNELNGSITASEQKKTALDGSIETAEAKDTALKQSIENAGTEKAALDKSRTDAETTKQNLDNSKSAADTSKQNLDKSIQDAGTENTNLNNTVNTANTAKEQIQEVVNSGNNLKTWLDGSISSGTTLKGQLETAAQTGGTIKTNLEQVIQDGNGLKTELDTSIQTAEQKISTLTEKNTAAEQNASTLATRNATAEKNLADLKAAEGKASEILVGVEDIKAYLGYPDTDIVGVQVDYANKSFQRLAGAYGLLGGSDFDKFEMFGGRRRCNLADDGTINAFYGDEGYTEDGSNGQVMVYQPKFYYKVVPLVLEPISGSIGYHLRKANYYVSTKPKDGFKLHPAFYDENGAEIDHIFLSAFEGSVFDVSANAYLLHDEQVADFSNDLFCSIAGVKPASGLSQNLTRPNIEAMAKKRGSGWHGDTIKAESANQLLMIIEMGTMNLQTAIGQGIVSISDNSSYSCTSLTGSTSSLGNGTGMASETVNEINGVQTTYTNDERTSVTYRGMENPWGNIWKFVYDVNFYGNGSMRGGVPYICNDFNFAENKNSGNYESAGFTLTNAGGYISAMGYGNEKFDWLFFASECSGNSSLPVGDYTWVAANLNGFRIARLGGSWSYGGRAGAFALVAGYGVGARYRDIGGRLVYIPKAAEIAA